MFNSWWTEWVLASISLTHFLCFNFFCFATSLVNEKIDLFRKLLGNTTTPNRHLASLTLLEISGTSCTVPYFCASDSTFSCQTFTFFSILIAYFSASACNIYKPSVPDYVFHLPFVVLLMFSIPTSHPAFFPQYSTAWPVCSGHKNVSCSRCPLYPA